MNPLNECDGSAEAPIRSTEDMLRDLCEAQRVRIAALVAEREELRGTLGAAALNLIEESDRRKATLLRLSEEVETAKQYTLRVAHERDTVIAALRALTDAVLACTHPGDFETVWDGVRKAWREASELLTLIDQAQAARAAPREG